MANNTAVEKVKEKSATDRKIEKAQEQASDKLSNAAEVLHSKTDQAQEYIGEKVESVEDIVRKKTYEVGDFTQQKIESANALGHRAADMLDNSSTYIKTFDARETKDQVIQTLKEKPEIGIAAAGIFGILIGYLAGRKSK